MTSLVSVVTLWLMGLAPGQEPTVIDVINAWEAGCNSITSYRMDVRLDDYGFVDIDSMGKAVLKPDRANPVVHRTSNSRITRSGNKRRGEFHLNDARLNPTVMIEDEQKAAVIDPNTRRVTVQRGILAFGATEYEDYEVTYRTLIGSTSRIDESRKRSCQLLQREGKLYVLDVSFAKDFNQAFFNFCWRVWLDPDKNFMPVRIEGWYDSKGIKEHAYIIENTLSEVVPGVWAPINSTRKIFGLGEPKDPLVDVWIGTATLQVLGQPVFNEEVDDRQFAIDIPFGYQVNDQIRNIVYTKGSSDPDRYIAELTKNAATGLGKLPESERRMPRTVFVPEAWWFRHRVGLAWASAALLVLGAALSYRHFRRSQGDR